MNHCTVMTITFSRCRGSLDEAARSLIGTLKSATALQTADILLSAAREVTLYGDPLLIPYARKLAEEWATTHRSVLEFKT